MHFQQAVYDPSASSNYWVWHSPNADVTSIQWREMRDKILQTLANNNCNQFAATVSDPRSNAPWLFQVLRGGVDRMMRPGRYIVLICAPYEESSETPSINAIWNHFSLEIEKAQKKPLYYELASPAIFPMADKSNATSIAIVEKYEQDVQKILQAQRSNAKTPSCATQIKSSKHNSAMEKVMQGLDFLTEVDISLIPPFFRPQQTYLDKYLGDKQWQKNKTR